MYPTLLLAPDIVACNQFSTQGHRSWVLVVSWSPDGQFIASGDMDGNILLWSPSDGKLLGSCSGHKKWITSLVGHPGHSLL